MIIWKNRDIVFYDALNPASGSDYAALYHGGIGVSMERSRGILPVSLFKAIREIAGSNLGHAEAGSGGVMEMARDLKGIWTELSITNNALMDLFETTSFPSSGEEGREQGLRNLHQAMERIAAALETANPFLDHGKWIELGDLKIHRFFSWEENGIRISRDQTGWTWSMDGKNTIVLSDPEMLFACEAVCSFESAWISAFGSQIVRNGIMQTHHLS